MIKKSSDLRKERLEELEEDYNRIQSSAFSFISETEDQFESTIMNMNNSSMASSIQIDISARSTQSKAKEMIRSFENLETRYRLEASNLRKELKKIEKRIHYIESLSIPLIFQSTDQLHSSSMQLPSSPNKFGLDDETYDSVFLPDLPKNESFRVDRIENQIKQIEHLLNNDDVDKLEEENQKELQYIIQLEEENKRLRSKNQLNSDSTTMSLSSLTSFSPIQNRSKKYVNDSLRIFPNKKLDSSSRLGSEISFTSKDSINSSRVQKNIDSLISVLNDRRLQYKMDLKETKKREEKLKKYQEKQKEALSKKLNYIEKLKKKLNGAQKYTDAADQVQSNINDSRNKLNRLKEEKEQVKRKNYTNARDKHANSEARRRLNQIKDRVEHKQIENDLKEKELEKRRKIYNDELDVLGKRGKVVEAREKEVANLMGKLSSYGIDFKNKLVESQKELEARNLAASLHKKETRKNTLEQQLVDLLQNASSDVYDD